VSLPPFAEALSIGEAPHHFESHPSVVDVSDTDAADCIVAKAALRDELERIAAMSILPSIRNSSLLYPDSVRTEMEPTIVTW
jgi:hypothetical protein